MSQAELLALVVQVLNSLDIPCMVVGSHASSWHGEPRSSHDIDLLVDIQPDRIDPFVDAFDSERFYLSKTAIVEGRMANLIDTQTGDKVDLFLVGTDPHNQTARGRRQAAVIMDVKIDVASAEDTILSKLKWHRMAGGSERQLTDVMRILVMQRDSLDHDYLGWSAKTMGTYETLQQCTARWKAIAMLPNDYEHEIASSSAAGREAMAVHRRVMQSLTPEQKVRKAFERPK